MSKVVVVFLAVLAIGYPVFVVAKDQKPSSAGETQRQKSQGASEEHQIIVTKSGVGDVDSAKSGKSVRVLRVLRSNKGGGLKPKTIYIESRP